MTVVIFIDRYNFTVAQVTVVIFLDRYNFTVAQVQLHYGPLYIFSFL